MARADELVALGETSPRLARDPVNQPQVHTWLEAAGDPNPVYRDTEEARALFGGPVAPPAMAQVWTMYGLGLPGEDPLAGRAGDPLHRMMGVLDEAGFPSVLGTNCDQTYARHLRPGDHVSVSTALESVVGPKRTGVGEGYFVTSRSVWRVGDEEVATMLFRVLKFTPRAAGGASGGDVSDPARTVRPVVNRDNAYFFEGTAAEELRIQRCEGCGLLRHPPGPVCPQCHSTERGWVRAAGTGRLYSWTEHHAPQVPGKKLPLLLGVVELDEGVRMIGELRGVERNDLAVGTPLQVGFDRIDNDLTLAYWEPSHLPDPNAEPPAVSRPSASASGTSTSSLRSDLRDWELPVTTTLVVSTALATRDFQDVHHDPDLARGHGSKDIFLTILRTTGLVQRYVGEWAGWGGVVRSCELRLGAPAHPGDTLRFSGHVSDVVEVDGEQRHVVEVTGQVPAGAHVTARVTVALPGGGSA